MLFTDIEGSTRLLQQLGTQAFTELLAAQRRTFRAAFFAHGGQEMGTEGDSFFVVFRRAGDAVAAAVEAQQGLSDLGGPEGVELRVRMGMHTGEPSLSDDGYHGLGVHRAARISALGHGGQVLLSGATRAVVADELAGGLALRDLGEHQLKDFEEPERIFEVRYPGAPEASPPLKSLAAQPADPPVARRFARSRPQRRVVVGLAAIVVVLSTAAIVLALGGEEGLDHVASNTVAVLSADGLELESAIPVGAAPGGIAVGEGSIWVSNTDEGTVSRIDRERREVVQVIPVGNGPAGIAVAGGFVWVANSLDGTVSRIDPRVAGGRELQKIRVGNQPTGVAAGHGSVWVANVADKTLSRIEPETGEAAGPISAGAGVDVLAVGPSGVWVASRGTDTVTQLDPRSGSELQRFNVGRGPSAMAVTADAAWVATEFDGTLARLDPDGSGIRSTPVGASPGGVAADGRRVRVTDGAGRVTEVDARSGDVERRAQLGGRLGALAATGGAVYVTVRDSGAGHRGGMLEIVGDAGAVDSVDPALAYGSLMMSVTGDGLVGFRRVSGTAGGDIVPDLAERMPTIVDGGRTLTFRMRRGVRYSNGEPVRAGDIRRGIERSLDIPDSPGPLYYDAIVGAPACAGDARPCDLSEGVVADEESGTVVLHLTRSDPDILYKLAQSTAFAVPASAPRTKEAAGGVPGTGPYRFARVTRRELLLVRNPYFEEWSAAAQPAGYPDRIHVSLGPSADEQLAAIRQGRADLLVDSFVVSDKQARSLSVAYASRLRFTPRAGVEYAFLDTRSAPFDDPRVRRAVNLAVDRRAFTASFTGKPTCQILPPNSVGYVPYCPFGAEPDLPRARRLVARSGTRGARIRVWVLGGDRPRARMQPVVTALRLLGYRPSVREFKLDRYFPALDSGAAPPQVGYGGWFADFPTASDIVSPLLRCASPGNYGRFCDRRIDVLAGRAARLEASDPRAAYDLWARIDRRLTDAAPWVPLVSEINVDFVSERVRNFQVNWQGIPMYSQIWVR
jgi:peptide/nickel transport system substrate-binding protein